METFVSLLRYYNHLIKFILFTAVYIFFISFSRSFYVFNIITICIKKLIENLIYMCDNEIPS